MLSDKCRVELCNHCGSVVTRKEKVNSFFVKYHMHIHGKCDSTGLDFEMIICSDCLEMTEDECQSACDSARIRLSLVGKVVHKNFGFADCSCQKKDEIEKWVKSFKRSLKKEL